MIPHLMVANGISAAAVTGDEAGALDHPSDLPAGSATKPKYIPGEPIAGSKHYLLEEAQQRDRGWLQKCAAYERLRGSGVW
jgi:hypothetical protein